MATVLAALLECLECRRAVPNLCKVLSLDLHRLANLAVAEVILRILDPAREREGAGRSVFAFASNEAGGDLLLEDVSS